MAKKAEFPSLFPSGFNGVTLEELHQRCVSNFPLSRTRPDIMKGLELAVQKITTAGFPADLWIDGSFVTEKIDPSDVDVALIVPSHVKTAASATINQTLQWILDEHTHEKMRIDGHVLTKFDASSPMHQIWDGTRNYYTTLFGTKYDDTTPKGVAVIKFLGGA